MDTNINTLQAEKKYQELQELVGIKGLKDIVQKDLGLVLHNKRLRQLGRRDLAPMPLHMVFLGNPGTGKTKAARLLGAVYKSLGLLSSGHVHEVSRADLVGNVIGLTEKKTREAIEKAKGGFLFIDEAYALRKQSTWDFGMEAIEVLLKAMSDMTSDFGVIVAGYPEPMREFLAANPGLRSRFHQREILFPDFTPDELMHLAHQSIRRMGLQMSRKAEDLLRQKLMDAYRGRDESFGNARYVKSVVQEARSALARRLQVLNREPTDIEVVTIELTDVQRAFATREGTKHRIPIDESALVEALGQLGKLAGIASVKQEVAEMVDLVRYHLSIGKDPKALLNSHFVFTGNPGTGKTTVARMLAQIYRALGLLERGHLVECDRQSLVAGWVGQTALKTAAIIEKAHGGVLFIDEAYSLIPMTMNDFGPEAVEVLLKKMEDDRGKFVVIVAGYPREMEEFLTSNPGLKSRFDMTIQFEDYDSGELSAIAESLFAEEELTPDDEAMNLIETYFESYVRIRDRYSGNARDVWKLVKRSIRNQNLRLSRLNSGNGATNEEQKWIRREDLSNWKIPKGQEKHPIGFGAGE